MVVQYPHMLVVTESAPSGQDGNGNWTQGATSTTTYQCRAEYLRGGGFQKSADGTVSDFNWLVYMPLMDGLIKIGSQVIVTDNGVEIITGVVKRFLKAQFNVRVWI